MGKQRRSPITSSRPTVPPEALDLPERWSAQPKMEPLLHLLRGEALAALSRETRVPAHLLESWQRRFLDAGTNGLRSHREREEREVAEDLIEKRGLADESKRRKA